MILEKSSLGTDYIKQTCTASLFLLSITVKNSKGVRSCDQALPSTQRAVGQLASY